MAIARPAPRVAPVTSATLTASVTSALSIPPGASWRTSSTSLGPVFRNDPERRMSERLAMRGRAGSRRWRPRPVVRRWLLRVDDLVDRELLDVRGPLHLHT